MLGGDVSSQHGKSATHQSKGAVQPSRECVWVYHNTIRAACLLVWWRRDPAADAEAHSEPDYLTKVRSMGCQTHAGMSKSDAPQKAALQKGDEYIEVGKRPVPCGRLECGVRQTCAIKIPAHGG